MRFDCGTASIEKACEVILVSAPWEVCLMTTLSIVVPGMRVPGP